MNRLKGVLGLKTKPDPESSTISTISNLREMEEMLGKKQVFLEEQIQKQLTLAKKLGMKNKRAALAALKRKKRYEIVLQQLDGTLSTVELQRETLEQAKTNVSVLTAMKTAAQALKSAQQHMNVDKVNDIMDEISEQQEVAQEISQAISSPMSTSFGSDIDDHDLELELEALEQEDLDKELLHISLASDPVTTPTDRKDTAEVKVKNKEPGVDASGSKGNESGSGKGQGSGPKKEELDEDLEELKWWASST